MTPAVDRLTLGAAPPRRAPGREALARRNGEQRTTTSERPAKEKRQQRWESIQATREPDAGAFQPRKERRKCRAPAEPGARGRHRRRREPRACFGELLHLDGSPHAWLALAPAERHTLLAVIDDATKQVLYAELVASESTATVMTALRAVLDTHGLPMALYTDRAHWAFHTPTAGAAADRTKLTQVGRALAQLGIEHIPAYSPQARGRSERLNRTLQDRLVNELRVAGIRTVPAANRYLRERFLPAYNARFTRPPADPESACVPLGRRHDLEQILCHQEERTVAQDNTVTLDGVRLQIAKQRGRRTCAGPRVLVRRHLDGRHSVWWGTRCFGCYDARGRAKAA